MTQKQTKLVVWKHDSFTYPDMIAWLKEKRAVVKYDSVYTTVYEIDAEVDLKTAPRYIEDYIDRRNTATS